MYYFGKMKNQIWKNEEDNKRLYSRIHKIKMNEKLKTNVRAFCKRCTWLGIAFSVTVS